MVRVDDLHQFGEEPENVLVAVEVVRGEHKVGQFLSSLQGEEFDVTDFGLIPEPRVDFGLGLEVVFEVSTSDFEVVVLLHHL